MPGTKSVRTSNVEVKAKKCMPGTKLVMAGTKLVMAVEVCLPM